MPKQLRVRKSARLAAIVSILGNASHADALHVIAKAGDLGVHVRDVQEALACSRTHANKIVSALEGAGYIVGDPRPENRGPATRFNATVYRLNRPKVRRAIDQFAKHVLAE